MEFGLFTHIPWTEGADPGRVVGGGISTDVGDFEGGRRDSSAAPRNDMGGGGGMMVGAGVVGERGVYGGWGL